MLWKLLWELHYECVMVCEVDVLMLVSDFEDLYYKLRHKWRGFVADLDGPLGASLAAYGNVVMEFVTWRGKDIVGIVDFNSKI